MNNNQSRGGVFTGMIAWAMFCSMVAPELCEIIAELDAISASTVGSEQGVSNE